MKLTEEQKDIKKFIKDTDTNLAVNAFAGSGKTFTLVEIVKDNPDVKFLYLAFNRAVKEEALSKFPRNCDVHTLHGLAYRFFATDYLGRKGLRGRLKLRWKNTDYIDFFQVKGSAFNSKNLIMFAARQVVRRFKNSEKFSIDETHIDPEHVLQLQNSDKKTVLDLANKLWELESDPKAEIPIDHDTYLKCFQLSEPDIKKWDTILLDEAQDTNPVAKSIVDGLSSRLILVGDTFQAIYSWRGAVDFMKDLKNSETLWLTKSFRFGEEISKVANKILKMLDPTCPDLIGNETIDSRLEKIESDEKKTVLFRTNAELARAALGYIKLKKEVYVEGGVNELCDDLTDLYALYTKAWRTGKSNKYRVFKTYQEVVEEGEHFLDIAKDIKFIHEYGSQLPAVIAELKSKVRAPRDKDKVDCILSTAHKAKGLQWDNVQLHNDFGFERESYAEWCLIYVAITRAVQKLQIPSELHAGIENYVKKKYGYENTDNFKNLKDTLIDKIKDVTVEVNKNEV